ncbi:MAG: type II toxin-antitoxin system VapC family toxin [Acidovorax sp.]|uniref:type II toxin-antitoxin system VapC family toxin n=1 Tax=Acidovorax sp. TaxID=1872122 RepID=UPI0039E4A3F2
MKFLLDTCLLSELVRPAPAPAVLGWMSARASGDLFVSALTLAELERGIVRLPPSRRQSELAAWLASVQAGFGQRALPFTRDTAGYWARLCAQAEAAGKPMAAFDSLIAATALEHGLAVATRNVRDFASAPVVLVNPWETVPGAQ